MQPEQPNPDYNFILKDNKPPKAGLGLPSLNLPGRGRTILVGVLIFLLLIMAYALFFGGSGGTNQQLLNVLARAEEIKRISVQAESQSNDANVKAEASTVQAALLSQQQQITTYLKVHGTKVDTTKQTQDLNKDSDTQLAQAVQAGTLGDFYTGYLKTNLALYKDSIQTAYNSAGPKEKALLVSAFSGVQVLLAGL